MIIETCRNPFIPFRNQQVAGSNPIAGSNLFAFAGIPCSAPSPKLPTSPERLRRLKWRVGDLLQG